MTFFYLQAKLILIKMIDNIRNKKEVMTMLSGILHAEDISQELLEEEKKKIERKALERFLETDLEKQEKHFQTSAGEMLFASRESMLEKQDSIAMERILGKNDLFPISYLQTGLNISKAICRISIRDNRGVVVGYGTGFLVSPHILLTNNHVIRSQQVAFYSLAEFNYQDDEHFMPCPTYNYRLDPETFFITNEYLDFTMVALKKNPAIKKNIEDFGYLPMIQKPGNILQGEYVSIIQHPKGGPKSVTLRENKVSRVRGNFIHYLTDTEPGSSGSPVFNDQWTLVALHHAGVPDPEQKNEWIANEGIRISSIVDFLARKYSSLKEEEQILIREIIPDIRLPEPIVNSVGTEEEEEIPGYNSLFLGKDYEVPLPTLSKEMEEDVAKTSSGSYILDYTHFSIVMKRSRGLAYFTAVNINGGEEVKIPRSSDNWKFDTRISKEYQYGDELYINNELDRGHLVRRMDPNWGKNAIKANEDTFYFTNSSRRPKPSSRPGRRPRCR